MFPPAVGKFHPSVIAPFSAKKLGYALFGKLRAACKITDFDPLRFSFYGLPTTFSRFHAFGAKARASNLFSSIHNPMAHIAAHNPMPSVGVGLGGLTFFLLLSSDFCHLFFLHRGPGASSRYPPKRLSLLSSGLGPSPHRSSFPEKARSFSAYGLAFAAISPSSRYHFFRGPISLIRGDCGGVGGPLGGSIRKLPPLAP